MYYESQDAADVNIAVSSKGGIVLVRYKWQGQHVINPRRSYLPNLSYFSVKTAEASLRG